VRRILLLVFILLVSCGTTDSVNDVDTNGPDATSLDTTETASDFSPEMTPSDSFFDAPLSYPPLLVPGSPVAPMLIEEVLPVPAEGLAFHGEHLYLTGTDSHIYRLTYQWEIEDFATLLPVDGEPGDVAGLAVGPDDALYACRFSGNRVERIPIADPANITIHFEVETPNSLAFVGEELWYTSSGQGESKGIGHLGRFTSEGTPEILLADIPYANGLAFSPDGQWVYISSTDPGSVLRCPIVDGLPGPPIEILDGAEMAIADGLAIYPDGTLFIAGFGTGKVYAWTDVEGLQTVAESPNMGLFGTASIAFGEAPGFGATTLYATNLLKPVLEVVDMAVE
jgi:sugar lactone lactonase YvrE